MCEQVQGDEIEVREARLQGLGLELSDRATAYVCGLPVFDELCDAVTDAIHAVAVSKEQGVRQFEQQIKRAYVLRLAAVMATLKVTA